MSEHNLLEHAAQIFGDARLVSEVHGLITRHLEHRLEIRGRNYDAWRPLANVSMPHSLGPVLTPHPKALDEDVSRAARLMS